MRFLRTGLTASLLCCLVVAGLADESRRTRANPLPPALEHALVRDDVRDPSRLGVNTSDRSPSGNSSDGQKVELAIGRSRILLGVYCALIVGASLFGGWLPQRFGASHTRMQMIISLIAGLMLSIGIFHMLPHALVELGDEGPELAAYGMMAGLVVMFLLLRMFSVHHHRPAEVSCQHDPPGIGLAPCDPASHAGQHALAHKHSTTTSPTAHRLSWVGVCLGMGLHTLIDGLALGASVESDALQGVTGLCGLGTFLAVVLHKPLDSASITSLMSVGGWSSGSRTLANSLFALICPLGAGLFVLGLREFSGNQSLIVGCALAVSAGVFLCIALADLLPEMEFHSHNRVRLTVALIAGITLGWGIHFVDPAHTHSHEHAESTHAKAAAIEASGRIGN